MTPDAAAASLPMPYPRRILMTLDAVGGVWRYALDLARGLKAQGVATVFLGFGPPPSKAQWQEAAQIGTIAWAGLPLDWMVDDETPLNASAPVIARIAAEQHVDLIHLNLPSQAAGLDIDLPVVVVSHSCVVTWFDAVRGCSVPAAWRWQKRRNREGLERASRVLAPSRSHAEALIRCYGPIEGLKVVHNATAFSPASHDKTQMVFAAGRWWDEGKNGAVLDGAAAMTDWPVTMAGPAAGPNGESLRLHNVRHAGALSHTETMAMMARAAIVVSPSLYEPFGLAALEGARAGAAIVLADIPTYRELWDDAALFADPRDPQAFALAINRLAADDDLRAHFAERARERSHQYSLEAQARSVLDIYGGLRLRTKQLMMADS